jgi:signal transduction histidine kinase
MLFISVRSIVINKNAGNLFIPIGLIIVIITSTSDALVTLGVYYLNFLNSYGFLIFLVGIAISLAIDYGNTSKAKDAKTTSLINIKQGLTGLSNALEIDKLVNDSLVILRKQLNVVHCSIVLTSDDSKSNNHVAVVYGDEIMGPLSDYEEIINADDPKPFVVKDIEDTFSGMKDEAKRKLRELMVVPMVHMKKEIGFIAFSKKIDGSNFTEDDKEFVSIAAPQLALAVKNARAYNESQEEIKRQRDALIMSEKMAAIGQLTSGIGHEINNPINFIISYVPPVRENVETLVEILELYDKLHSDGVAEEEKEQILKKIENIKQKEKLDKNLPRILRSLDSITDGATRVANIVDSLKAFARMDTLPTEIDINSAIDKSLIILTNKLKNRVEVHKDYDQNAIVTCYASIHQVIINLLANAADAIEDKGEIFIKTQSMKDKLRFSIKDTGKGMTEETKAKLFTPFFTTKGPGKGTGLGLSISYNVVYDQHKGSIDIQSEPNNGSTFTVTIPKDISA